MRWHVSKTYALASVDTNLSWVVWSIIDIIVGQGEGVETSCNCPGVVVYKGVDGQ